MNLSIYLKHPAEDSSRKGCEALFSFKTNNKYYVERIKLIIQKEFTPKILIFTIMKNVFD